LRRGVELVTCNPIDSGRWVYTATDRPGGVAEVEEEEKAV
jgi:hypothetical protein